MTINRDTISQQTLELKEERVPHIVVKETLRELFKTNFRKTDTELYDTMDAFVWALLNAVIDELKSRNTKQPSVQTFLQAFNQVNAPTMFIGTLKVETEIFSTERRDEVVAECIRLLEEKYSKKIDVDDHVEKIVEDDRIQKWDK